MGGLPKLQVAVKLVATMGALFIFSGVLATATRATTFSVTDTGDNGGVNPAPNVGTGTLRQAIVDANNNAGADTITFSVTGTTANGLAPQNSKEAGIFASLPPGSFTAILAGKNGGVGIGLIEVYNLK